MIIDWGKAPEGATHKDLKYAPDGFWYKFDFKNDTAAYCVPGEDEWVPSGRASGYNDGSMRDMAARPTVPSACTPNGATHKWSASGQFAKRCDGNTWAIWQDDRWLWIGDEFKGDMVQIFDPHKVVREEIIRQMAEIISTFVADVAAAEALYDAGYRKFEIVEDDV